MNIRLRGKYEIEHTRHCQAIVRGRTLASHQSAQITRVTFHDPVIWAGSTRAIGAARTFALARLELVEMGRCRRNFSARAAVRQDLGPRPGRLRKAGTESDEEARRFPGLEVYVSAAEGSPMFADLKPPATRANSLSKGTHKLIREAMPSRRTEEVPAKNSGWPSSKSRPPMKISQSATTARCRTRLSHPRLERVGRLLFGRTVKIGGVRRARRSHRCVGRTEEVDESLRKCLARAPIGRCASGMRRCGLRSDRHRA